LKEGLAEGILVGLELVGFSDGSEVMGEREGEKLGSYEGEVEGMYVGTFVGVVEGR